MCGLDQEPDEPVSKEDILKGKQLLVIMGIFLICIIALAIFYEIVRPVINNPKYPFYNKQPNYKFTFIPPKSFD
uniref:ODV-E18 n=1 Tax=Rhabditophanes sp. KR3021 TaxID=114890 RepID=A0AC35U022_9BILA